MHIKLLVSVHVYIYWTFHPKNLIFLSQILNLWARSFFSWWQSLCYSTNQLKTISITFFSWKQMNYLKRFLMRFGFIQAWHTYRLTSFTIELWKWLLYVPKTDPCLNSQRGFSLNVYNFQPLHIFFEKTFEVNFKT